MNQTTNANAIFSVPSTITSDVSKIQSWLRCLPHPSVFSLFHSILRLVVPIVLCVFHTVLDAHHPATCCNATLPAFQHVASHAKHSATRTQSHKWFPNMCSAGLLINVVARSKARLWAGMALKGLTRTGNQQAPNRRASVCVVWGWIVQPIVEGDLFAPYECYGKWAGNGGCRRLGDVPLEEYQTIWYSALPLHNNNNNNNNMDLFAILASENETLVSQLVVAVWVWGLCLRAISICYYI